MVYNTKTIKNNRKGWENMKKTNNKGFSLVELIIVIAIMAVLVGILAPQFIKYVEKSKVSTDIKNAQEIATALQVGAADSDSGLVEQTAAVAFVASTTDAFTSTPTMKSKTHVDANFFYTVNTTTGEVHVFAGDDASPSAATALELYPVVDSSFKTTATATVAPTS
jgi:type IV pilus assembly protein PilA